MKFINITHNDLDGIGCSVVASYVAKEMNLEFINYNVKIGSQGKLLSDIIASGDSEIREILISDMGISDEMGEKLNDIQHSKRSTNVTWIDHHETNVAIGNKFEWATVRSVDGFGVPISATKLMVSHYKRLLSILPIYDALASFAEIVSRYDTWEWKNNPSPVYKKSEEDLNILLQDLGIAKAIQLFSNIIEESKGKAAFELPAHYKELVKDKKEDRQLYIDNAIKRARTFVWHIDSVPYRVKMFIPKEKYFNAEITGIYEDESFEDLDFVVGLVPQNHSVSLRSNKKYLNLGEIAAKLGGGGHFSAAGAILPVNEFLHLLEHYYYYNENELEKDIWGIL
jgi:oligoribonuclease NrnB/cAMP/cGMP phosphodiesterase (DHH superfamily)